VKSVIFPLLFVATWTAMVPAAIRLADSQTHFPPDRQPLRHFPLIVMTGSTPQLIIAETPHRIPPLPAGSSYLIPAGADRAIENRLNERHHDNRGRWVLSVRRTAPGYQRIELYWLTEGYSGGAYDATATSITPRYLKLASRVFPAIVVGVAFLMTAALWLIVALLFRQFQGSSAVGP
jgi:hypothetical protein